MNPPPKPCANCGSLPAQTTGTANVWIYHCPHGCAATREHKSEGAARHAWNVRQTKDEEP